MKKQFGDHFVRDKVRQECEEDEAKTTTEDASLGYDALSEFGDRATNVAALQQGADDASKADEHAYLLVIPIKDCGTMSMVGERR
jgi:hypothetical protein